MCWSRNIAITCRCIASRKSTRGKAWSWNARRWRTGWAARAALLAPLVEALRRHVLAANKLHADDTPVPVLAPGNGKTKTGRLWTYVRDDRPAGDATPAAVWFAYSPDRKGEHPQAHLGNFTGTLQADGYAGFDAVYETGRIQEAACWAHVRRKFYDLHVAHKSPVAAEALERIAALYAIEKEIRGHARRTSGARSATCEPAAARIAETMAGRDVRQAVEKIRHGGGGALRARRWEALMRYVRRWPASRSTTTPPNAPCAPWPWAGRTTCSPAPTRAANVPPQSTA